jgi:hypothetical protein
MHSIGIHRAGDVGPVVDDEDSPRLAHTFSYPLRTLVEFAGRRVLISKLNQPDARRQKSRRHLDGGGGRPPEQGQLWHRGGDYKLHEPISIIGSILDFGLSCRHGNDAACLFFPFG